ncbi:Lrp/AsnC family transcriptional regulator [Labrys sp. La1]|uniref:Lrp/AsnC family transcriptional regulator n=1 Tax=Labrys sp. La1 TaxID=3404917 RepID=UPI003EB8F243
MTAAELDALDRRIIRALQREANISHVVLAEQIGSSPASCWRRIKKLEEIGVLGPTVRLVSPESIGRGQTVFCQIRMKSQDPAARKSFELFVGSYEEVLECYAMTGDWDYVLRLAVKDIKNYERLLLDGILAHSSVATSSSHFALKEVKYTTILPP